MVVPFNENVREIWSNRRVRSRMCFYGAGSWGRANDTCVAIRRASAEQRGEDVNTIRRALENPEDFDAIVTRARE